MFQLCYRQPKEDPVLTGFNTLLEASYTRFKFSDVLQGCVNSQKLKTIFLWFILLDDEIYAIKQAICSSYVTVTCEKDKASREDWPTVALLPFPKPNINVVMSDIQIWKENEDIQWRAVRVRHQNWDLQNDLLEWIILILGWTVLLTWALMVFIDGWTWIKPHLHIIFISYHISCINYSHAIHFPFLEKKGWLRNWGWSINMDGPTLPP